LPPRYAWRPTRCIMQKIISVSSFGHHSETRQTPSHHRHGSQARADCLPSAEHEGSLQRECLSPLRRRSLKARSISTPETSRTTGISTHPNTWFRNTETETVIGKHWPTPKEHHPFCLCLWLAREGIANSLIRPADTNGRSLGPFGTAVMALRTAIPANVFAH
jgi:hypothetical protein